MQSDYDGVDQQLALESALTALAAFRIRVETLRIEDGATLGRGGFAIVRRATWNTRGEGPIGGESLEVAVKELLPKQNKPLRLALRLIREIKLWSSFNHPNILGFWGFHLDLDRSEAYLISPFLRRGSLRPRLKASDTTMEQRWHWALGITEGLKYLHTLDPPIVHGDIKADNVLLSDEDEEAVLCDFGVSSIVEQTVSTGLTTSNGLKSSLRWCAPELFEGALPSLASDVWAWGLTILETMTGRIPYEDCITEAALLMRILKINPVRAQYPELTEDQLWYIANQCWNRDVEERIRIEECHRLLIANCVSAILVRGSIKCGTDVVSTLTDMLDGMGSDDKTTLALSERLSDLSKLVADLHQNEEMYRTSTAPLDPLKQFQTHCTFIQNEVETFESQAWLGKVITSQDDSEILIKLKDKVDEAVKTLSLFLELNAPNVQRIDDHDQILDQLHNESFGDDYHAKIERPRYDIGHLTRKACSLILDSSGLPSGSLLNLDPRQQIEVGEYGKVDETGWFIPYGSIYTSKEVREAIPDILEHPPRLGIVATEEKLKSYQASSWSFDLDHTLSVGKILDDITQLHFNVANGQRAAYLIMNKARRDYLPDSLPTDRLLKRLSKVKELADMFIVTERAICYGYNFGITTIGSREKVFLSDTYGFRLLRPSSTEAKRHPHNSNVAWTISGNAKDFEYVPLVVVKRMRPKWADMIFGLHRQRSR